MLCLNDLMQRDVVSVAPDLTLRELVEVLAEHGVSGVPVVTIGRVIGVVSTTDIFDFREETRGTASPSDELDGVELARRRSPGSAEFFFGVGDPADSDTLELLRTSRDRTWDLLDEYTVADVMTRDVVSQPSSATVKKAAQYMLDAGIHRILVIDAGELKGIITTTDIVRAVAEGRLAG
jgi:CBS domain-containing protein